MKASGDLHGGFYCDAIIAQFTGKGTGACYNPTKTPSGTEGVQASLQVTVTDF